MVRRFKVLASLTMMLALFAGALTAHAQGVGLALGANFNELSEIDAGDHRATFDNASGWHVHLWVDLPVGPVSLRPGVRYMDAGEIFQDSDLTGVPTVPDESQVVSLLEIPIDVRFRMPLPLVTPYVLAGPVLRFPANPSQDDEGRLESFSFAGGLGVGAELGLAGVRLFPELKYTFGITRFTKEEYQIGGVTLSPDEDQRLNAIMLSLGIGL